jgi:hypothetical protein
MIFLLFTIAIISVTVLLIALLNYRLKIRIIRAGLTDENAVNALTKLNYSLRADTLKWGLILLFGGVGLIVLAYIHLQPDSTAPYGIEALFLAAGFLTYYLITKKSKKS